MSNDLQLDFLIDGAHFDSEFRAKDNDLPFYLNLAGPIRQAILELGVGTGRIAIPLALRGHRVHGVDFSESMLTHTRRKALQAGVAVTLDHSDIRHYQIREKYDLILCPFNTLMHFDAAELNTLLTRIREALNPGGAFVLDITNPSKYLNPDITRNTYSTRYPLGEGMILVSTELSITENCMDIIRNFTSENGTQLSREKMRMYFFQLAEWIQLLNKVSFSIEKTFGNYDRSEYCTASPCLLLVCRGN